MLLEIIYIRLGLDAWGLALAGRGSWSLELEACLELGARGRVAWSLTLGACSLVLGACDFSLLA